VFEWVTDGFGGAGRRICAAGANDGLLEQIGASPRRRCGFANGIERLLALLADRVSGAAPTCTRNQGEAAERFRVPRRRSAARAGFGVVQHCGGGKLPSRQIRKADAAAHRSR